MKDQNKISEKELNNMEKNHLPDANFKTLAIKVLSDLSENFNKETGNIKMELEKLKSQSEM